MQTRKAAIAYRPCVSSAVLYGCSVNCKEDGGNVEGREGMVREGREGGGGGYWKDREREMGR